MQEKREKEGVVPASKARVVDTRDRRCRLDKTEKDSEETVSDWGDIGSCIRQWGRMTVCARNYSWLYRPDRSKKPRWWQRE